MKKLLKLFSIISLSTTPVMSVVACGNKPEKSIDAVNLNGDYATLLGWYSDKNTSKIIQGLQFILVSYFWYVKTDIITNTNFKDKLLTLDPKNNKYKAINATASDFLKELGFIPDNNTSYYSNSKVENINKLKANLPSNTGSGNVSLGTDDFLLAKRNIQIDIKLNDKITNSYTAFTQDQQPIGIPTIVSTIITSKSDLTLDATSGFQENKPITNFILKFTNSQKQKQWDSLVSVLKQPVVLNWYNTSTKGAPLTGNFTNIANNYLTINFGTILVTTNRIDCGQATN